MVTAVEGDGEDVDGPRTGGGLQGAVDYAVGDFLAGNLLDGKGDGGKWRAPGGRSRRVARGSAQREYGETESGPPEEG